MPLSLFHRKRQKTLATKQDIHAAAKARAVRRQGAGQWRFVLGVFAFILMGAALVGPMRCMVERHELPEHLQKSLASWTQLPLKVVVTETPLKAWTTQYIALEWETEGVTSTVATGSIRYRLNERPLLTLNWDWMNPPASLLGPWRLVSESFKARMVVKLEDFDRLHVDVMSKGTFGITMANVDWTMVDPHLTWDGMNKVWTCEAFDPVGLYRQKDEAWQVTGSTLHFWMGKKRFQGSLTDAIAMTPDKSTLYIDDAKVTFDMQNEDTWLSQWTLNHVNILPHAPWWVESAHAPSQANPEPVAPGRHGWLESVVLAVKEEGQVADPVNRTPTVVVNPQTSEHPEALNLDGIKAALSEMPHPTHPDLRIWLGQANLNFLLRMNAPLEANSKVWWDSAWWQSAQAHMDEIESMKVTWTSGEPTSQWTGSWKLTDSGWTGSGKLIFTPKAQRFTPKGISALAPALWAGAGYQKLNQSWHGRWAFKPGMGLVALPYEE